jgi:hypothetical protein
MNMGKVCIPRLSDEPVLPLARCGSVRSLHGDKQFAAQHRARLQLLARAACTDVGDPSNPHTEGRTEAPKETTGGAMKSPRRRRSGLGEMSSRERIAGGETGHGKRGARVFMDG